MFGNHNYGNILQRCALARVIESLGFEVWHLCEVFPTVKQSPAERFIKHLIKRILARLGNKRFQKELQYRAFMDIFEPTFASFQDKYVTRRIYMTHEQVSSSDPSRWAEYDYAVTGSDQVWTLWMHTQAQADFYYLSFMPREKRVCYAPSFGFPKLREVDYERHQKGLAGFERLSCREQEMIPMIKQACGKDAQLVLDPTLLLSPEDWQQYEEKPYYDVPEKYVLCYFLDKRTPKQLSVISKAAGDLPVIDLYNGGDTLHLATNPGAFLYLMRRADFICTDSFHGTVFSIMFRKNFLTLKRKEPTFNELFGRLSGLLNSVNITGHVYDDGAKVRPDPINYNEVYSRLEALRNSSIAYLKECLHVH